MTHDNRDAQGVGQPFNDMQQRTFEHQRSRVESTFLRGESRGAQADLSSTCEHNTFRR